MKKLNLFLFISSLVLLGSCQRSTNMDQEPPQLSGAYEALNFLGAQRNYPLGYIPNGAYFHAWQQKQQQKTQQRSITSAPWETMGPHNRGGRTLAIAINPQNPNTLFAGSASGGLWRSYTAGYGAKAWERVETGFPVLGVSSIAISPVDTNTIFIGTGEVYNYFAAGTGAAYRNTRGSYGMGILKSTDGGQSWELSLDWSYDQNRGIWAVRFDPQNTNILYAATTEGVYKSSDAGQSWTQMMDVVMANDLIIHPDNPNNILVGCGNFASSGFGIYRSTDAGQNWTKITSNLPTYYEGKIQLAYAPSNPDVVYASIGNGFSSANGATWLCRSNDFGANWTVQSTEDYSIWQGWFSHDVAVHPQDENRITTIGITVWQSNNGGSDLSAITTNGGGYDNPPINGADGPPNYVHADCHDVVYHPSNPDIIYVANDGGIHVTVDGGGSFRSINGGYQTAQFYNGFTGSTYDSTKCLGGLQDNGTIRWNNNLTWRRIFGGDGSWTATNHLNDNIVFASYQFLNVMRSEDGGNSFSGSFEITSGENIAFIAPYVIAPSAPNVMYAGASRIYRSIDGGINWTPTNGNNPLKNDAPALCMAVSHQSSGTVYVGLAPSNSTLRGAFVTTDGGNSWQDITSGLPSRYPMDVAVDPTNDSIAYMTFSGFGTGHVFKTIDRGQNWINVSQNLPDLPVNAVIVDPDFPQHVYIGNDLGVYISQDGGETWYDFNEGLPEAVMVFDLSISPANRKLRIASHGLGAYQRDLLEEPLVSVPSTLSKSIIDFEVYPNPAKNFTQVIWQASEPSLYNISIIDTNGNILFNKKIKTLSGGPGKEFLNVDHLQVGTYFVRISSKNRTTTKKLIVY